MASTVLAEAQSRQNSDHRLSLCVDVPPSSSPFPSPSSSFLPPPVPGVHEFAVKIPPGRGNRKSAERERDQNTLETKVVPPATTSAPSMKSTAATNGKASSGISSGKSGHTKGESTSSTSSADSKNLISPSTPTQSTASQLPSIPQIQTQSPSSTMKDKPHTEPSPATTPTKSTINIPVLPGATTPSPSSKPTRDSLSTPQSQPQTASPKPSQRDSLTSSRPAPPSPSVSRRASAAPSTSSAKSRSSRPSSTANLSRASSKRKSSGGAAGSQHRLSQRLSQLQISQLPTISTPTSPSQSKDRPFVMIKIRDFAFPPTDPRHTGHGPNVPKPNKPKVLNRKLGGGSTASSSAIRRRRTSSGAFSNSTSTHQHRYNNSDEDEDGEEDDEDDEEGDEEDEGGDGWGGFKFGVGRFSWGPSVSMAGFAGAGSNGDDIPAGAPEGYPTLNDLRNNFANDVDDDESNYYDADEGDDDEGGPIHDEDTPLYPGLYRALYAFEPEGTAEMALEEDQIVKVIGRGGGVGWAVVDQSYVHGEPAKAGGGHALVPESYLEVYELDEE